MFVSPGQFISIDVNRFGKVVTKTSNDKFDRDDRYNNNNRDHRDNRNDNYGRH
jgi:hypothetical protein